MMRMAAYFMATVKNEKMKNIQLGEPARRTITMEEYFFIASFIKAVLFFPGSATAQPYVDIAKLKYTNSPNTGFLNQNKNDVKLHYFSFETNLPLQFNNKKDAVIFSPFFENWSSKINNTKRQNYYGLALPVTLSKTIPQH